MTNHPFAWSAGMVSIRADGPVALLTLDRPEKLNALDRAFWTDLCEGLAAVAASGTIRAVILRGAGERAFCAGGDVASFAALSSDEERRIFQVEAMAGFAAIERSPVPVIAAIHGLAFGGGCELAMACDMVVAARTATFALPEARFGLVPGYGAIRAAGIVGAQMAKLMIYAGERIDAETALRCGLVQKLVDPADLDAEAMRIARAIAAAPPTAIAAGKRLIDPVADTALATRSIDEIAALHATAASRDAVAAFLAAAPGKGDDHG